MLLEAHYGVPLAGAVLVAVNTRLSASEIGYILDHSGVTVVIVDAEYRPVLSDALRDSTGRPTVILAGDDGPGQDTGYELLLADARPHRVPVTDERSLLSLNYTSGTTGQPKGVMYHHRGAYLQAVAMAYHATLDTSSRYLWTLPMFHTNGWCFPWAVTAAGGVHHCLRRVDSGDIWRAIRDEGISHFCAAPTVLAMLADHPAAHRPPYPVKVFTGGAPPWPALLERMDTFGIDVHHLYGLTETFGPVLSVTNFDDADEALKIANDTPYGLGAGVWSRDINTAYRLGRGIKAGRVWTNCYHVYPAHAAFGGYKQSGIGRETHKMALDHYQQTKNMLVSYSPRKLGFF